MLISLFIILTIASVLSILLKKRKKGNVIQKGSATEAFSQRMTLCRCIESLKEQKNNEFTELVANTFFSIDEQFAADPSANEALYYKYISNRLSRNALNPEQKRANTCITKIISLLRQSKSIEDILQQTEDTYFPHVETSPSEETTEFISTCEIIEANEEDDDIQEELSANINSPETIEAAEEAEPIEDDVVIESAATEDIAESAKDTQDIVDIDFAELEEIFNNISNNLNKTKYLPHLDYVKTFEAKKDEADLLHKEHKFIAEKELIVNTIILFHEYNFPVAYWEKRLEQLIGDIDRDHIKNQRLLNIILSLSQRKRDIKITSRKKKAIGELMNLLISK